MQTITTMLSRLRTWADDARDRVEDALIERTRRGVILKRNVWSLMNSCARHKSTCDQVLAALDEQKSQYLHLKQANGDLRRDNRDLRSRVGDCDALRAEISRLEDKVERQTKILNYHSQPVVAELIHEDIYKHSRLVSLRITDLVESNPKLAGLLNPTEHHDLRTGVRQLVFNEMFAYHNRRDLRRSWHDPSRSLLAYHTRRSG